MMTPEALNAILERITQKQQTDQDIEVLRRSLRLAGDTVQWVSQDGKFNTNVGQITGGAVHIGDRIYQGTSAEAIRDIIQSLLQELQATAQPNLLPLKSVDALVEQVRSRLHDDIQRLHGTMPLWGVDHWVPLGDLFVDVNILEELSSSRRSELADLWQDFSKNPSYRSLDRIGLGRERQRVSGLEVLAKHTNLMVVGKPGSGKTTYLQRVVTECNAGNLQAHKIPVLIRLREFIEDGRDIAYSLERYLERCWQLSATKTQLVLNQGRSLVLLDGLDEVAGEDGKTITKQIKQFARAYPQVQMVVTCRTQSQESRFERFDYVEVADFNEPQVRAFAEHWFQTVCADQGAGQAKAQVFLDQLFQEENIPIRELAITPILLSLTCAVFQQKQAFYSKRSKLYEEGLELLLEQWDKSRKIERDELYRDLSVERKLELLSYLAVKKFEQAQYVLFEQTEIEGYIAEFLGIGLRESRAVLRAIESQHGLLIERSLKIWSFSHLSLQEYLVANCFRDRLDWQKLFNQISNREWREVFTLTSEMTKSDIFLWSLKQKVDGLIVNDRKVQDFLLLIGQTSTSIGLESKIYYIRLYSFDLLLVIFISQSIISLLPNQLSLIRDLALNGLKIAHSSINYFRNVDFINSFVGDDHIFLRTPLNALIGCVNLCLDGLYDDSEEEKELLEQAGDMACHLEKLASDLLPENVKDNFQHIYPYFDLEQIQPLIQYRDASWLLVECSNRSFNNDQHIQEVCGQILLPIAEIEKRKREKVE